MEAMIKKKALLDDLKEIKEVLVSQGDPILASVLNRAIACVKKQPVLDAVEVVHGEWSTIEDDYCGMIALECSECKEQWWFEDDPPIEHYHYCPNCGAKMDGGNVDD